MVTAHDRAPLAVRAINAVGAAAARAGLAPSLDEADLLQAAMKATRLTDFGGDEFRPGLARLLASLEEDGRLNTLGRIAARTRILTLLRTRLGLIDHRKRHPHVTEQQISQPLFVLGLPRTGTTLLYGLLAADARMREPISWEVAYPFPPRNGHEPPTEPRIRRCEREFDQLRRIAPGLDAIHPLGALLPQECMAMQAPAFLSYEFPTTFRVPGYWTWLQDQDVTPGYEFQRQFLQHLQSGFAADRWILKTPAHLLWLDVLLEVFPDALVVQTHRNPTTVLASVSSLMYALRKAVGEVDPHEVGRDQLDTWSAALERATAVRDERLPAHRVVDVMFEDTLHDPVGTVRRIYEHFSFAWSDEVEAGVHGYLAENPRTKHGRHTYSLADFGIAEGEADERFATYRERFGIGL